jgi:hypothetical protein
MHIESLSFCTCGVEHHNPNPESLSSQQFHQFQQNQQSPLTRTINIKKTMTFGIEN